MFKSNVAKLLSTLVYMLEKGFLFYTRAESLSTAHYDEQTKTLYVPNFSWIANNKSKFHLKEAYFCSYLPIISGSCREITVRMRNFLAIGCSRVINSAEIYGCAANGEAHYVLIVDIKGRFRKSAGKFLVDLGYSQPVPQLIPLTGKFVTSDFYAGEKQSGQLYAGKVFYQAINHDDSVAFTISTDKNGPPIRSFEFHPISRELDEAIIKLWASVTCNVYTTHVIKRRFFKESSNDLVDGSKIEAFTKLHKHLQSGGDITVIQYSDPKEHPSLFDNEDELEA